VMLVCLEADRQPVAIRRILVSTHIGNSAVCTPADLRFIQVYEDSGVAKRSASAVTFDCTSMAPANGLPVEEVDGS